MLRQQLRRTMVAAVFIAPTTHGSLSLSRHQALRLAPTELSRSRTDDRWG
ncbi:hypothetical protein [Nocardiopsis sp. JB363]|nr:hypothetical protein [Nocardiopsis sp. JB363]SIO86921.1 hypothetical protein BQ8420_14295 [Nocardiopsis sp. JB363]